MDQEEIQNVAFTIILHSGNSRTMVHEGFELMRNGEYEKAEEKLQEANDELTAAHQSQTSLMQKYTSGEDVNMDIIMVHAQDHMMTTMTLREVAIEMLSLYQNLKQEK
ncbi:PTS cellobiose transporter subunit IIA [Tetragenococcus halophilus]|uniref:PTS cellobiose transporter subunit IIA n=1 Tax=Tetragenococcus halophilus TaxID=51669 RepID=UPI0030F2A3DB